MSQSRPISNHSWHPEGTRAQLLALPVGAEFLDHSAAYGAPFRYRAEGGGQFTSLESGVTYSIKAWYDNDRIEVVGS